MKQIDFSSKTIDFVKRFYETSKQQILDALGFSKAQFQEFLNGEREINAIQFFNLAQTFNFSFKAFFENKVDIEAIKKHNAGDISHVPKEYQTKIGTKNFIISLSLEYVEIDLGPSVKQNIINYLQLPAIYDPEGEIGQKASDDLNNYLDSLGFTPDDYLKLGYYCISRIMQTFFPDTSGLPPTLNEYIKWFFEEVMPKWVEKNCIYKISKIEEGLIEYEAQINPELKEKFTKEKTGTLNQCFKKIGGTKALIDYYASNNAVVTHPKCLHQGDDVCLFVINY